MPVAFAEAGYLEVWRGDVRVSRHRQEREAIESVLTDAAAPASRDRRIRVGGMTSSRRGVWWPVALPALLIAGAALAGSMHVTWTNPTKNTDDTDIPASGDGSLDTLRVEYGYCAGAEFGARLGEVVVNAPATSVDIGNLPPGNNYCVRVFARNTLGAESDQSNVGVKLIVGDGLPALQLDAVTRAEYDSTLSATTRAQAVLDALADPVTVRVYNGSGQVMSQGTMATPWATRNGGTLTVGQVASGSVLQSGTPDGTWYLSFESGTRWLRGTYGPGGNFAPRSAAQSAGAPLRIGTVTLRAYDVLDTVPPSVPTGLAVAVGAEAGSLDLSWTASTDVSSPITYVLERSTDQVTWTQIAAVTATAYSDTGLTGGQLYYYRLRARDPSNNASAYTAPATGTPST